MAARPLQDPSPDFGTFPLEVISLPPDRLCRISRFDSGEPYFGRRADKRFDDPNPDTDKRFGTCYLGLSFAVAFTESILHDAIPTRAGFDVSASDIDASYAHRFAGATLQLAKMTGSALSRLGGNGELSGTPHYTVPQKWSVAVCRHSAAVDGFIYRSRLLDDGFAVVLFERDPAAPLHLSMATLPVKVAHHEEYARTIMDLNVRVGI